MQHAFSSQVWNKDALAETAHTPDVQHLYSKLYWNVFMYDKFDLTPKRAIGFTNECYTVWRQIDNDGLVAIHSDHCDIDNVPRPSWADPIRSAAAFRRAPATRVKGSIHLLEPATIISIDRAMGNGINYIRKRINILVPTQQLVIGMAKRPFFQMYVSSLPCWIWEGKKEVFDDLINGIDYRPADIMRPDSLWIGDFYTKEKPYCPK